MDSINDNRIMENEDEITIRDICLAVWMHRKLIISLTIVVTLLAGVFTKFVIPPVYQTDLNIVINIPSVYPAKYGDYTLPVTSNDQYIKFITNSKVLSNTVSDLKSSGLTVEKLKKKIAFNQSASEKQNIYNIKVSATTPKEASLLANTLYNNYISFLNNMLAKEETKYFSTYFSTQVKKQENELKVNRERLKKNEALLAQTPQIQNQKDAIEKYKKQLNSDVSVVLDNMANPNYSMIEKDILKNKQNINSIETTIKQYNEYLEELKNIKTGLINFNKTGKKSNLIKDELQMVDTYIYLPSDPITPKKKSGPSTVKNTAVGACAGMAVAIIISLLIEWFKKESKAKIDKKDALTKKK